MLSAAFDAPVVFRDPHMAAEGDLTNTHIRLGDSFLETVSPSDHAWASSTTQTRLLERKRRLRLHGDRAGSRRRGGVAIDGGAGVGRRIVSGSLWVCPGAPGSGLAGMESRPYVLGESLPMTPGTVCGANVQFHPRDFGTLAEIQENWPGQGDFPRNKGAYFPAGNTWQNGVDARPHGRVTTGFAAVEIAPRDGDPAEVCRRWMQGLGAGCSIDPAQPATLRLAGGQTMRFVEPEPGGRTGVVGVDLWAVPGARKTFASLDICGVKWTLVDHAGSS